MSRHEPPDPWTWGDTAAVLGIMAAIAALLWLGGCAFAIPVRAVPTDEPILVAPVGDAGGVTMNADLPQPDPAKFPSAASTTAGWGMLWQLGVGLLLGGGGIGAVAVRSAGRMRTALSIATQLADQVAQAETDEQVAAAKREAMRAQEAAGVRTLTQRIRGKG